MGHHRRTLRGRRVATRTMYDSISAASIPATATIMAGYINGNYRSYEAMRARFPFQTVLSISVDPHQAADILDIETGDATPAQSPAWVNLSRAAGHHPTLYMNGSTYPAVLAANKDTKPDYWGAIYDGVGICPPYWVAKQFHDAGPWDISVIGGYWAAVDGPIKPAPPAPPKPPAPPIVLEDDMIIVTLAADSPSAVYAPGWSGTFDGTTCKHILPGENTFALLQARLGAPVLVSEAQLVAWGAA